MIDFRTPQIQQTNPAGGGAALDPARLDELRALDSGGPVSLVKRVLSTYQGSLERLLEQLRSARALRNWEGVGRVAHTLKSSSASIGASEMAALCAEIERLVRQGETARAEALLGRFDQEIAQVEAAVRQALQAEEASRP